MTHAGDDPDDYAPVLDAVVETLKPGERLEVVTVPDNSETVHIDCVAVSKFKGLTYEVKTDDVTRYGQVGVPPTDVDDLAQTFKPALKFTSKLKTIVRNPSSTERLVIVQIRGWEPN